MGRHRNNGSQTPEQVKKDIVSNREFRKTFGTNKPKHIDYSIMCCECHTNTYSLRKLNTNVYICEKCFTNKYMRDIAAAIYSNSSPAAKEEKEIEKV